MINRKKNGESHVHIVLDLVEALEGNGNGQPATPDEDQTENSTHLAEFDRYIDNNMSNNTGHDDEAEYNFYTKYMNGYLQSKNPPPHDTQYMCFQKDIHY